VTAVAGDRDTATRSRILEAAEELTVAGGWSSVTMARIAEHVGVSRQTVYNEVGSKPDLAKALILEQLAAFLDVVERAFDRHGDDPVAAIRQATRGVLEHAEGHALLRTVVAAPQGTDSDLLPFLTTRSASLLGSSCDVLRDRLAPLTPHMSQAERDASIDVIVRTVLSHVVQPSSTPRRTAESLGWTADRLLSARVPLE